MVSWGDGEESSTDLSSDSEGPTTMYDSDFSGFATEGRNPIRCKCNQITVKNVAFEGCWTGRRFLSCAGEDNVTCDFVHWIDDVWPDSLCKALSKLWGMYTEAKDGRVGEALRHVESKIMYQEQICKLEKDLKNVQDEMQQVVQEKQVTLALKAKAEQALIEANAQLEEKKKIEASTTNMHKCLRLKAENDRDMLKGEKRKLEHMIGDLLKQKSRARSRINQIKAKCDEIYD